MRDRTEVGRQCLRQILPGAGTAGPSTPAEAVGRDDTSVVSGRRVEEGRWWRGLRMEAQFSRRPQTPVSLGYNSEAYAQEK